MVLQNLKTYAIFNQVLTSTRELVAYQLFKFG